MPTWRTGSAACAAERRAAAPARKARSRRVIVICQASVGREAVEQAVAAGALRSAWLQPPSGPREGCDEFHDFDRRVVAQALRSWWPTIAAPAPLLVQLPQVVSSPAGNARAVGLRAGQDVVPVRRVAAAVDDLALLVSAVCLVRLLLRRAGRRRPWRSTTPLAFCHGPLPMRSRALTAPRALRAEIGAPGLAAGARRLRERLAMAVGALEAAEIGALARRRRW